MQHQLQPLRNAASKVTTPIMQKSSIAILHCRPVNSKFADLCQIRYHCKPLQVISGRELSMCMYVHV